MLLLVPIWATFDFIAHLPIIISSNGLSTAVSQIELMTQVCEQTAHVRNTIVYNRVTHRHKSGGRCMHEGTQSVVCFSVTQRGCGPLATGRPSTRLRTETQQLPSPDWRKEHIETYIPYDIQARFETVPLRNLPWENTHVKLNPPNRPSRTLQQMQFRVKEDANVSVKRLNKQISTMLRRRKKSPIASKWYSLQPPCRQTCRRRGIIVTR